VAPLRFASLLGVLLASVAFLFGLSILWETWVSGKSVPGYPSLVVGLMTIGGVQLIMIGIVGEYIGKILSELKARPNLFCRRTCREARRAGSKRAPANGPPPNERRRAAAPIWLCADDYGLSDGVNRAIRDLIGAAAQCDIGDGGRPGDRPRRGRALQDVPRQPALRDRPACDADRAVPSADDALPADRWRHVSCRFRHAAIGPVAAARSEMIQPN
jgi:hypothetical protein